MAEIQKLASPTQQQPENGLQQPLQQPTKQPALQRPAQTIQTPQVQQGPQQLTMNDFITQAQKLGRLKASQSAEPILEQFQKETAPALQRQLYGSGLGTGSGVGQQLTLRATEDLNKRLAQSAERVGLETAQQELGFRQQEVVRKREEDTRKADQLLGFVNSGQITGKQAEDILTQQGINPVEFMTPEQVQSKQRRDQFDQALSETIKDPSIAALIDNEDELAFYMENGKTFEDEVADIVSKSETFEDWNTKKPELVRSLASYERQLNDYNAWLFKDPGKIAATERKIKALEAILSMLDAGQAPSSKDIASL